MNTVTDPLAQLKDIHLPEPVAWWPPAPGWWLAGSVALALLIGGGYLLWRFFYRGRYKREALAALQQLRDTDQGDERILLAELSRLLRQVAIARYGRQEVAALSGAEWLLFLDRTGQTDQFSYGPGRALGTMLYQPSIAIDRQQALPGSRRLAQEATRMLTFLWPWIFLLLPLPWLVYRGRRKRSGRKRRCSCRFIMISRRWPFPRLATSRTRLLRIFLLSLIWLLLLVAAGQPQWVGDPVALPVTGRDLMLAVDISGSMAMEDMVINSQPVSRIKMVKKVVNDFIDRRQGDRIGLLLFGSEPYIQAPLTFDRKTVKTLFNEAQLGFAGKQTSLGDAIGLAIKRLKERPDDSRVLILLTDGMNTAGKVPPAGGQTRRPDRCEDIYHRRRRRRNGGQLLFRCPAGKPVGGP